LLALRREDDHGSAGLPDLFNEFTQDKTFASASTTPEKRHRVG
jgi:hypothetical protein